MAARQQPQGCDFAVAACAPSASIGSVGSGPGQAETGVVAAPLEPGSGATGVLRRGLFLALGVGGVSLAALLGLADSAQASPAPADMPVVAVDPAVATISTASQLDDVALDAPVAIAAETPLSDQLDQSGQVGRMAPVLGSVVQAVSSLLDPADALDAPAVLVSLVSMAAATPAAEGGLIAPAVLSSSATVALDQEPTALAAGGNVVLDGSPTQTPVTAASASAQPVSGSTEQLLNSVLSLVAETRTVDRVASTLGSAIGSVGQAVAPSLGSAGDLLAPATTRRSLTTLDHTAVLGSESALAGGEHVCIMTYPPPPGCGGLVSQLLGPVDQLLTSTLSATGLQPLLAPVIDTVTPVVSLAGAAVDGVVSSATSVVSRVASAAVPALDLGATSSSMSMVLSASSSTAGAPATSTGTRFAGVRPVAASTAAARTGSEQLLPSGADRSNDSAPTLVASFLRGLRSWPSMDDGSSGGATAGSGQLLGGGTFGSIRPAAGGLEPHIELPLESKSPIAAPTAPALPGGSAGSGLFSSGGGSGGGGSGNSSPSGAAIVPSSMAHEAQTSGVVRPETTSTQSEPAARPEVSPD